jgi:hypothetical protein
MKTGVRTSPWAVVIVPSRAREFGSVFSNSKLNAIGYQSEENFLEPHTLHARPCTLFLFDEHTIAVTEEPVPLLDGLLIGLEHQIPAGERAC